MSFTVIIPARYASTRLPGKPLLSIAGKPMIAHVVGRARLSGAANVFVATDDERIRAACETFGARVCMTSPRHRSGTDRVEEAARWLGLGDDEIIVNVQGDEPLIPPAVIGQVAENGLARPDADICTLYEPIRDTAEIMNPNVVKLVTGTGGKVLYFSRAPIPFHRDAMTAGGLPADFTPDDLYKRHVGIYAYRAGFLRRFTHWPPGELESREKLEQLRALERGAVIHAEASRETIPAGVDTEQDFQAVREIASK